MASARESLLVGVGGGIGACFRYLLSLVMAPWSSAVPFDYLLINVLGSFAIGGVLALTFDLERLSGDGRLFWAVGVLGGFTTFSTFEGGVYDLLLRGHVATAAAYGIGSLVLGLSATYAGVTGARALWRERSDEATRTSEEPLWETADMDT